MIVITKIIYISILSANAYNANLLDYRHRLHKVHYCKCDIDEMRLDKFIIRTCISYNLWFLNAKNEQEK